MKSLYQDLDRRRSIFLLLEGNHKMSPEKKPTNLDENVINELFR